MDSLFNRNPNVFD
jgi:hypothetical protein